MMDPALRHDIGFFAYPPRGMDRIEAARYVGVGVTLFDEMVSDGRMPQPKKVNSRRIWDRLSLDAAFTDLPDRSCENHIDAILVRTLPAT